MAAISTANATWEGDLITGHGHFSLGSGVLSDQPVSWAARTERAGQHLTSPEELLAGAHAACYAMAFSHTLALAGHPPTRLEVSAACTFSPIDGGFAISAMDLQARGQVPGLDQARFEELARQAELGCPVSNAIRNNVRVSVTAQLDS